MSNQNNRKCKHGNITFGDDTKCNECHLVHLQERLSNSHALINRLYDELDYSNLLQTKHYNMCERLKDYLNQPFIGLICLETVRRINIVYLDIYDFTIAKKPLIIAKLASMKQALCKLFQVKTK